MITREYFWKRLQEVKDNQRRIERLDGDALKRVGANEPLATARVLKALEDGPKTSAEILAHARADGYNGPEGRLRDAIGKLADEFRSIRLKNGRYFISSSPRSAGPSNRSGRSSRSS